MNLKILSITLLLMHLLFCGAYGRVLPSAAAVNDDELDNSIDVAQPANERRTLKPPGHEDFIKFVNRPPTKVYQQAGKPLELVCQAAATGIVKVKWYMENSEFGELIDNELPNRAEGTAVTNTMAVHLINHPLREPHTFTCIVHAHGKSAHISTTVYPAEKWSFEEDEFDALRKPLITYAQEGYFQVMGNDVVLTCRVHAPLGYTRTWTDNANRKVTEGGRLKVLENGDLLIPNLAWNDMGVYKCSVENAYGSDSQGTFVYPMTSSKQH